MVLGCHCLLVSPLLSSVVLVVCPPLLLRAGVGGGTAAGGGWGLCATTRFWETVKRFYLSDQRNFDVVLSFNEKPVRLPSGGGGGGVCGVYKRARYRACCAAPLWTGMRPSAGRTVRTLAALRRR